MLPERVKDLSVTNWSSIAASGPKPCRQAPTFFDQDLHPKMPVEVDISTGINRHIGSKKLTNSPIEKRNNLDASGRLVNGSLKHGASLLLENGTSGRCILLSTISLNFNILICDDWQTCVVVQLKPLVLNMSCWPNLLSRIYVTVSKCDEQPSAYGNDKPLSAVSKDETSSPHIHLAHNHASKSKTGDHFKVSVSYAQRSTPPTAAVKNFGSPNGVGSSGESRTCNERPQGRNQLLPRYWPKITDKELQQMSGEYPNFLC